MNKVERKNKIAIMVVMALAVLINSIYFTTITSNAAHQSGCSGMLVYCGVVTNTSSYHHNSQYGICTVYVKELFNYYKCPCGAENVRSYIGYDEIHTQPHG